ncbi:unnamed protein product (macronuclear) [Paramecium tetraurelia]|uniref:Uncharacterized protein n=1 Tax=Paramecium tetraurelia TaxID=5888 RepID=A0BB84_PARTE|nr:uncharacterized protein GSPATT00000236001 [Paramecium tetraurelia]CAK55801.1 unnamed protein product [Paramecium tetraurelia]|eukprot:XP_001423199.1 hypothetical protein (macronuclear) [Paramecium tetraurelia strain d4-2]
MEKNNIEQFGIYCQDDQHFHKGQKIKYLMVKEEKGSITKRLFCDECFLGKYSGQQQYCCDLTELINGNIYEAFKYTLFDSDYKKENHQPYLDEEFIKNMIGSLKEEFLSILDDLEIKLLDNCAIYKEEIRRWAQNDRITDYFDCQDLREKILDKDFERSPKKFDELNKLAEQYLKIEIDKIIGNQKKFFNLDRFNLCFKETIQQLINMQQSTFSDYKFSQSILATPYIEKVIEKIYQGTAEDFIKNLNLIYRKSQQGSNFQNLQKIPQLSNTDTITIIQTKNKCIFGVYNCNSQPQKSILFQMNKEKFFLYKGSNKALTLNERADKSNWILKFGDDDVVIQSTFSSCTSNLGKGFDIDGNQTIDKEEYLSDSKLFDIYDMEIFEVGKVQKNEKSISQIPPNPNQNIIPNNISLSIQSHNINSSINKNPQFPPPNQIPPQANDNIRNTIQHNNQSFYQNTNPVRQTDTNPNSNSFNPIIKK